MSRKVIIFGTGTFAEVVLFYLKQDMRYDVVAFTATDKYVNSNSIFGFPLVPFERIESFFSPHDHEMFIAIGYSNLNKIRERFYYLAKEKGYKLLTYISPMSVVLTEKIGDNCFIFENNTIQPYVSIGNNVIIWSGNHIGHHSIIEDHCFISSHVVISGHCHIKKYTFLGVNSTIRDSVIVEEENIIGAGSLIMKNTKPRQVYFAKRAELFPKDSSKVKL